MQKFDASWLSLKGEHILALPPVAVCSIQYTGDFTLRLEAIRPDGSPLLIGKLDPGHGRNMFRLDDFEQLRLNPGKPTAEYAVKITIKAGKARDPQSDELPPSRPPADNLLAQLREKVRREMGVVREEFLNDTGLPGYELDDEEPHLFEEELEAAQQPAAKSNPPADSPAATEETKEPQE